MSIKTSLPYFFAMAALVGCSSSSNGVAGGGDAGDSGTGHDGGGGDGGMGNCPMGGSPICGSKDISLTVMQNNAPAANTPMAGVFVRASTSKDNFLDSKTDAMGVAHLLVDPAKGPFDVTVAIMGFNAVSVLGVTDSIPGNIIISAIGAMPAFKQFAATGTITGATATNKLQIDAYDWVTVVTKAGDMQYTTKFDVAAALMVPIPVSAIEVDGTMPYGQAVNGSITMPIMRQMAPMTIPITMPSPAQPATQTSIKINWPSGGVFTAAAIKGRGAPVTDVHIGNGIVEQTTASEAGAAMFVGVANIDFPMNGTSLLHLQTFGGAMKPDIAGTQVTTVMPPNPATPMDYSAIVYAHTLADGTAIDVGQVNAMSVTGTNLGDAMINVDSAGYDSAEVFLASSQGTTQTTIWVIYSPGGKVKMRGLPYLPGGVVLDDLGGAVSTVNLAAQVVKYVGAKNPWEAITPDVATVLGNAKGATLDPMRP